MEETQAAQVSYVVDWEEEVKEAEATGRFSKRAIIASWSWNTCPVGPAIFTRGGRVQDLALYALGKEFAEAITVFRVQDALATYKNIRRLRANK